MGWTAGTVVLLATAQNDLGVRPAPSSAAEAHWPQPDQIESKALVAARSFSCTVASVTDGDTFRCSNVVRIRLSSIDTPEMPGSCQVGRSCAPGNPYAAKAALACLIAGRTVQCEPVAKSYKRIRGLVLCRRPRLKLRNDSKITDPVPTPGGFLA